MNVRITNSRRGVSLTELLMLMSSCTMILMTCGILLHRVMRVQVESRAFVDAERNSERLSLQFRRDVHQATAAEADRSKLKNDVFLQLQLSDSQTIEYAHVNGDVVRVASNGGKTISREEFAFEPSCKLTVRKIESPRRIALLITSPVLMPTADATEQLKSYKAVPVGLLVEASVGRDVPSMNPVSGRERVK